MSTLTKSQIFALYNKARAAARKGKLEPGRVNKALGLLQSTQAPRPYNTTIKTCTCPDFCRTGKPCKHMIAKMIEVRAAQGTTTTTTTTTTTDDDKLPQLMYFGTRNRGEVQTIETYEDGSRVRHVFSSWEQGEDYVRRALRNTDRDFRHPNTLSYRVQNERIHKPNPLEA